MDDETKDGGPAFPAPGRVDSEYVAASVYDRGTERDHSGWRTRTYGGGDGMSLRDYFAARLAPEFLSDLFYSGGAEARLDEKDTFREAARQAYAMADAMLEARAAAQPKEVEGD